MSKRDHLAFRDDLFGSNYLVISNKSIKSKARSDSHFLSCANLIYITVPVSIIAKILQKKFTAFATNVNRPKPCSASDKVIVNIDDDYNVSDDLD